MQRNRGIQEAKSGLVTLLDDDAIAFPDLVEKALSLGKGEILIVWEDVLC